MRVARSPDWAIDPHGSCSARNNRQNNGIVLWPAAIPAATDSRPGPVPFSAMPKYFFNTFYGEKIEDEVGEELPSRKAAWETATRYAADCLRDLDGKLRTDLKWRLVVLKEDKSRVFQITIHADDLDGAA